MSAIDFDSLRQLERDRAEDLCILFFPTGRKVGSEWKIGNVSGAMGSSLGIQLCGEKAGLWHDRATGEGGDLLKLIQQKESISLVEAVERIERALGVSLQLNSVSGFRAKQSCLVSKTNSLGTPALLKPAIPPWTGLPYQMTSQESRRAYEAAKALYGASRQIGRIAEWRGLKPDTIRSLVVDCALGVEGDEVTFLYETGMMRRPIGGSSDQCRWAFGKPFLWRGWPLVDQTLCDCVQRIHIAEGEFDCARLLELEFESDDLAELCLGIPGAKNFKPEWSTLFRGKEVVLWLDDDPAGRQATKRIGSFLSQAGARVQVSDLLGMKEALLK